MDSEFPSELAVFNVICCENQDLKNIEIETQQDYAAKKEEKTIGFKVN